MDGVRRLGRLPSQPSPLTGFGLFAIGAVLGRQARAPHAPAFDAEPVASDAAGTSRGPGSTGENAAFGCSVPATPIEASCSTIFLHADDLSRFVAGNVGDRWSPHLGDHGPLSERLLHRSTPVRVGRSSDRSAYLPARFLARQRAVLREGLDRAGRSRGPKRAEGAPDGTCGQSGGR
jgi:hypothetical protein